MRTRIGRSTALAACLLAASILAVPALAQKGQLNKKQIEDMLYVKGLTAGPGIPLTLDLSDPTQRRFMMRQFQDAGLNQAVGRQLHKSMNDMEKEHGRGKPSQRITLLQMGDTTGKHALGTLTQLSPLADSSYYAAGVVSVPDGTIHTTMFLQLFDAETKQPIGELAHDQVWLQGEYLSISATGRPSASGALAVFTYVYQEQPNFRGRPVSPVIQTIFRSTAPALDPVVNICAPLCTKNAPCSKYDFPPLPPPPDLGCDRIKICLNRSQFGDCVYDYTQSHGSEKIYAPVSGNLDYGEDLLPPGFNQDSDLQFINLFLTDAVEGGACTLVADSDFLNSIFTVNSERTTLSWEWGLPGAADTQYFAGPNCITQGDSAYLTFNFTVVRREPPETSTGFIFQSQWQKDGVDQCVPTDESDYVMCIPPLYYVWGCLAEGTKVLMADGTLKKIEEVKEREKVRAGGGRTLTVVDTLIGTEEKPLVVVEDDRGNSARLTEEHPVVTRRGVLLAKELQVGDELTTDKGPSKVVSVTRESSASPRKVFNLNLGLPGEGVTEDNTTLFADGILVGDNQMQGYFTRKYRENERNVRKELPPEWQDDYQKWLERRGKGKGKGRG